MWNIYGQLDKRTSDDKWAEKLTWNFSLGEVKTQAVIYYSFDFSSSSCFRRQKFVLRTVLWDFSFSILL